MDVMSLYIDDRFDYMETRQQWFEWALTGFFASQGYHHLVPFHPTYGQRGDGAGTSRAQQHDNEDDE